MFGSYSLVFELNLFLDSFRLALERAKTAKSAVKIIGELIEKYGQGGVCYDPTSDFSSGYDNSFLVVDREEAWIVEACDHVWVAKHIKGKFSSFLFSISKKIVVCFVRRLL